MSKGTVVAVISAVALLAAVAFFWSTGSDSGDDRAARIARRQTQDAESGHTSAAARERREGARASSESRRDTARSGERMARDADGAARRGLPPAIGSGRNAESRGGSAHSEGQIGRSRREPDAAIARPPGRSGEDAERERPELPEASDHNVAGNAGDDAAEPPQEPLREVAFDGGDRLFDTGVPMEVKDAGRISPDGGMVSFWVQPEWASNKEDSAEMMRLGETGLEVLKEGSFLRFQYTDANGNEQGGDADIGQWQDGEWHHVAATWTREGMFLYVDGGQAFANQGISRPAAGTDPGLFVGSVFPEGTGIALARMSNLAVINRMASTEEVQKIFAAGGPTK